MASNRRLVLLIGLLVAIAAAVFLRPKPLPVDVARVARGAMTVTVDEEGRTRVRARYVVAAPVSGRLERIRLEEGDRVEERAVVARMHPQPLDPRLVAEANARLEAAEAARSEAEARVEQVRASLEQAMRNATRSRRLAVDGNISKEELELSNLEETSRRKELAAVEHAAARAEYDTRAARAALLASGARDADKGAAGDSVFEVSSPATGAVLRVLEESERVVAVGTPLLEIGEPNAIEIVVDVLSKDAVLIRPGTRVSIEEWGGTEPLSAHVRLVEPSGFKKISALGVEEQRVNVIVDFDHVPEHVGDSFRVEARIVVWQGAEVLKIPASALFRRQGKWSVFVVEGGRAKLHGVEVGHLGNAEAEITAGLEAGTIVVLHPSDQLSDDLRVSHESLPQE